MNWKKICGIVCLVIGIALLVGGFYGKMTLSDYRRQVGEASIGGGYVPKNPITGKIESNVKSHYYREIDSYEPLVNLMFVGSGIFVIGGIVFLVLDRKRR